MNTEKTTEPSLPPERRHLFRTGLLVKLGFIGGFVLLVAGILIGVAAARGGLPGFSLFEKHQVAESSVVFENMRDLFVFDTVEYVETVVFPFDFMPEGMSGASILGRVSSANPQFNLASDVLKLASDPKAGLLPEERLYLKALQIANDAGLRFASPQREFVPVTVVVRAGFDVSGTPFAQGYEKEPAEKHKPLGDYFKTETIQPGQTGRLGGTRAVLRLPPLTITDIRIEDKAATPGPDVPLTPAGWKIISALVASDAKSRASNAGIIDEARKNAESFLRGLLLEAGFDEVRFE